MSHAAQGYRFYHQEYPDRQLAADLAAEHAIINYCSNPSMARWLYEHNRDAFSLYMESYIIAFNKAN